MICQFVLTTIFTYYLLTCLPVTVLAELPKSFPPSLEINHPLTIPAIANWLESLT